MGSVAYELRNREGSQIESVEGKNSIDLDSNAFYKHLQTKLMFEPNTQFLSVDEKTLSSFADKMFFLF